MDQPDDWEKPDSFWQICTEGGHVQNVSEEAKDHIMDCIKSRTDLAFVDDIYGDKAVFRTSKITQIRQWTVRGGRRYKSAHPGEEYD